MNYDFLFYSLTSVKKLETLRGIGLRPSIAFILVSALLLYSSLPSGLGKTNHNFCYYLALCACISLHSVRTIQLEKYS